MGPQASVPLLPDLNRHVRWLGFLISAPIVPLHPLPRDAPALSDLSAPPAPESSFPSRATHFVPVATFFGGEVARLTPPQLRGLVLHSADCAIVTPPSRTSCL